MLAAVPLCMLVKNEPADAVTKQQMVTAILVIGFVGTFYTVFGGIKTVVWVDAVPVRPGRRCGHVDIGMLLHRIPVSAGESGTSWRTRGS